MPIFDRRLRVLSSMVEVYSNFHAREKKSWIKIFLRDGRWVVTRSNYTAIHAEEEEKNTCLEMFLHGGRWEFATLYMSVGKAFES